MDNRAKLLAQLMQMNPEVRNASGIAAQELPSSFSQASKPQFYDAEAAAYDKPVPEEPLLQNILLGVIGDKGIRGAIGGVGSISKILQKSLPRTPLPGGTPIAQAIEKYPPYMTPEQGSKYLFLQKQLAEIEKRKAAQQLIYEQSLQKKTFSANGRGFNFDYSRSVKDPTQVNIDNLRGVGSSGGLKSIIPQLTDYAEQQGIKKVRYFPDPEGGPRRQDARYRMFESLMKAAGLESLPSEIYRRSK